VTTDIIILRKPDGRKVETHSWLGTRVVGNGKVTFKRGDMTPTQYLKGFDLEGTWEDESLESARQTWSDLRLAGLQIADGKEFKDEKKANADATAKAWKKYVETFESVEGNAIGMKLNATVPIRVNEYFAANPQNVFGTHALAGSMYSPNEYALLPDENGGTLEQRFAKVIEELPADIMGQASVLKLNTARDIERTDIPYSFVERDGKFWQVQKDRLEPVEWDFAQGMAFRSWKDVKDAARNLIEAELDPQAEGPEISALREKLNDVYAKHTSRFGPISKTGAGQKHGHLVEDPDYPLTVALEVPVKYTTTKGKSATRYDKADIFRVRMNKPLAPPATADNVSDALLASLVWIGYPHAGYMAKLLGQTEVNVRAEAIESELVFEDPTTGTLVIRDAYLSGHVQGKLEEARAAAEEDPAYRRNVAALEAALPERKGIAQIGVSMNSPWLPPAVMTAFM
jgi:N12 class adenine-specific DNA methylase